MNIITIKHSLVGFQVDEKIKKALQNIFPGAEINLSIEQFEQKDNQEDELFCPSCSKKIDKRLHLMENIISDTLDSQAISKYEFIYLLEAMKFRTLQLIYCDKDDPENDESPGN